MGIAKKLGSGKGTAKRKNLIFQRFLTRQNWHLDCFNKKCEKKTRFQAGDSWEDKMQNTSLKKMAVKKETAGLFAVRHGQGNLKQPGIIFSGFKSKLSSDELLGRMNGDGK